MSVDTNDGAIIFDSRHEAEEVKASGGSSDAERFAAEVALDAMAAGYDAETLDGMDPIHEGQADTCYVDDGEERVWLSRTGVADGEPFENTVSIERYLQRAWVTVCKYDGGELPDEDEDGLSGVFVQRIELGNEAMSDHRALGEALGEAAAAVAEGQDAGNVRDGNGNTVGAYRIVQGDEDGAILERIAAQLPRGVDWGSKRELEIAAILDAHGVTRPDVDEGKGGDQS